MKGSRALAATTAKEETLPPLQGCARLAMALRCCEQVRRHTMQQKEGQYGEGEPLEP